MFIYIFGHLKWDKNPHKKEVQSLGLFIHCVYFVYSNSVKLLDYFLFHLSVSRLSRETERPNEWRHKATIRFPT